MTLRRLSDWESRLARLFGAWTERPHDWGVNNCALRAAEAIEAQTGVDLVPPDLRAAIIAHPTEENANRIMAEHGWENVADIADAFLPRVAPQDAKRGDIVMLTGPSGDLLAIKFGKFAIGPASKRDVTGVQHLPLRRGGLLAAHRAWAVG